MIGAGHRPPGLSAVPMNPIGAHGHPRPELIEKGLVGEGVIDEPVDAHGEGPIALVLDRAWMKLPCFGTVGRESLRGDDRPAVHMGDGRRFDAAEGGIEPEPVAPEFAHRHVGHRAQVEVGGRVHVVGLDREIEPVAPPELLEPSGVVLDDELIRGPSHVPEKTLALFEAADDPARISREIGERIVAAPLHELSAEIRGPILGAHFPAVDMDRRPAAGVRLPRLRPFQELPEILLEVGIEGRGVELVAFEAESRDGRRPGDRAVVPPPEAEDRPLSGRDAPRESAVRPELVREIDDPLRLDGRARRLGEGRRSPEERLDAGLGRERGPVVERLFLDILDFALDRRRGESEHRRILVPGFADPLQVRGDAPLAEERLFWRRHGELPAKIRRAFDLDGARDEVGHRSLRLDPRAPAPGPARTGAHDQADAEPLRLPDGVGEEVHPLLAHQVRFSPRDPDVDLEEEDVSDPRLFHRLEVARDPLPVDVAVHEIPVNTGPIRVGRCEETVLQSVAGRRGRGQERESDGGQSGDERRGEYSFPHLPSPRERRPLYIAGADRATARRPGLDNAKRGIYYFDLKFIILSSKCHIEMTSCPYAPAPQDRFFPRFSSSSAF